MRQKAVPLIQIMELNFASVSQVIIYYKVLDIGYTHFCFMNKTKDWALVQNAASAGDKGELGLFR